MKEEQKVRSAFHKMARADQQMLAATIYTMLTAYTAIRVGQLEQSKNDTAKRTESRTQNNCGACGKA